MRFPEHWIRGEGQRDRDEEPGSPSTSNIALFIAANSIRASPGLGKDHASPAEQNDEGGGAEERGQESSAHKHGETGDVHARQGQEVQGRHPVEAVGEMEEIPAGGASERAARRLDPCGLGDPSLVPPNRRVPLQPNQGDSQVHQQEDRQKAAPAARAP